MRSRLLYSTLFVALFAAAAAAQQQVERTWLRVEPEGEEFAVHFPELNWRVRRALTFADDVVLKPASFEVASRGTLFSVLSFSKSERPAPKTLDAFVKGFRKALGEQSSLEFEREVKLDGRAGRQFRIAAGGGRGTARIFETGQHFYAVFTLGGEESASSARHFHDSFTFDRAGSDHVPLKEAVEFLTSPPRAPGPLWPVANMSFAYGVKAVNEKDRVIKGDSGPTAGKKGVLTVSVLNAEAVVKPVPVYPPIARAARASGAVVVQILVDEEGYVIAAHAVSGHPLLQQAAVMAARQARFTPTLLMGEPVKVSGVITYNFVFQ